MQEPATGRSVRRWWNRVTATILALGALAGAIGAILALRPAPDPEDSARFTAIQVDSPVALSEAKARLRALTSQGAGSGGRQDRPAPVRRLQPDPSANSQADPTTDTSAPDPTTDTSAPDPTSSDTTSSSSSEPTSSTPETTGQPTSSSPGMAPSMEFDPPTGFGQEEFGAHVGQVMKSARERNPNNPDLDCKDPEDCRLVRLIATGKSIAMDGTPVEPEVAAERLVKLLRNTRRTGGGGSRAREPLGVFVTVNLDLIGLRDREVLLSWSMFGGEGVAKRVHGDWLNDNLAYVLKATSDRDSTFQLIWIPLPRSPGPFRVQVHLKVDGAPLASQASGPFD